ncbi:MAG: hypothetical protein AABX75_01730 [Nanoarchaeota archaeon]
MAVDSIETKLALIDGVLKGKPRTLDEIAVSLGWPLKDVQNTILTITGESQYPNRYGCVRLGHGGEIVYFLAKPLADAVEILPHPLQSPKERAYNTLADCLREYGASDSIVRQARLGELNPVLRFVIKERTRCVIGNPDKSGVLARINDAIIAAGGKNNKPPRRYQM